MLFLAHGLIVASPAALHAEFGDPTLLDRQCRVPGASGCTQLGTPIDADLTATLSPEQLGAIPPDFFGPEDDVQTREVGDFLVITRGPHMGQVYRKVGEEHGTLVELSRAERIAVAKLLLEEEPVSTGALGFRQLRDLPQWLLDSRPNLGHRLLPPGDPDPIGSLDAPETLDGLGAEELTSYRKYGSDLLVSPEGVLFHRNSGSGPFRRYDLPPEDRRIFDLLAAQSGWATRGQLGVSKTDFARFRERHGLLFESGRFGYRLPPTPAGTTVFAGQRGEYQIDPSTGEVIRNGTAVPLTAGVKLVVQRLASGERIVPADAVKAEGSIRQHIGALERLAPGLLGRTRVEGRGRIEEIRLNRHQVAAALP